MGSNSLSLKMKLEGELMKCGSLKKRDAIVSRKQERN